MDGRDPVEGADAATRRPGHRDSGRQRTTLGRRLGHDGDRPRSLPSDWAAARAGELHERATALAERLPIESLCHWDVRNDNLLIRPDGTAVIVDWGMSRLGPSWADLFLLSLAWADRPEFDARAAALDAHPSTVTDLLIGLGGWLAFRSTHEAPPGIPTMPAFQRREARRILSAARRRLDKEPL